MKDAVLAYIRGRQEGYFNVRLDSSVLDMDQQSRTFFARGYHIGKQDRHLNSINESEQQANDYIENRKAYITIMGYNASCKGEAFDSSLLKGDDRIAFEEGYNIGMLYKNGNMKEMNLDSLEIYLMITGYEITDESYLVYLDMLKDHNGMTFNIGHKVNEICRSIQKSAINELKDLHLDVSKQDIKKVI